MTRNWTSFLMATAVFQTIVVWAQNGDVRRNGAFGFPQAKAELLCDQESLRVSAWSDAKHLVVQAVLWNDGDDSVSDTENGAGRRWCDGSALVLDVDADQKDTPRVDRHYHINPLPDMPGLWYVEVVDKNGCTTGLLGDSGGRGSIRYMLPSEGEKRVRVDTYVIPLREIGKRPGETVRFAFYASSVKPRLIVNSIGYTRDDEYYSHNLPKASYHSFSLSGHTAPFDPMAVPDGQKDKVSVPKRVVAKKPQPVSSPPESSATNSVDLGTLRTLKESPCRADLMKQINESRKMVKHFGGGHIVIGQVVLDGPGDPRDVNAQMVILTNGYFAGETKDLERPIGFRMHGYAPLEVELKGKSGDIVDLGQIRMRPLKLSERVTLRGRVQLEGRDNPQGAVVTFTVPFCGSVNTPHNGTAGRHHWPEPIKADVASDGTISRNDFSPILYWCKVAAPGYAPKDFRVDLTSEKEFDLGRIVLERSIHMTLDFVLTKKRPFDLSRKSIAAISGGDEWTTIGGNNPDLIFAQNHGVISISSSYADCFVYDMGQGELEDFAEKAGIINPTIRPHRFKLEQGHVYLVNLGLKKHWLLFRVTMSFENFGQLRNGQRVEYGAVVENSKKAPATPKDTHVSRGDKNGLKIRDDVHSTIQQSALQYVVKNGSATIIRQSHPPDDELIIPEMLDNYPVTRIGTYAFFGRGNLKSVRIPASVVAIEEDAFASCDGLQAIHVHPENPKYRSIDGNLYDKDLATLIEVPSQNKRVGIPATVVVINRCALNKSPYDTELLEIEVAEGNAHYSSLDGVFFNKGRTKLIRYPAAKAGNYAIPSTVQEIAPWAFASCRNLTRVDIPDGVKSIGEFAFADSGLVRVTIPSGVSIIGKAVFRACHDLVGVIIPEGVTRIENDAFGITGLSRVVIPSSVTFLGPIAFRDCERLQSVYFRGDAPDCYTSPFSRSSRVTLYRMANRKGWDEFRRMAGNIEVSTWDGADIAEVVSTGPQKVDGYTFSIVDGKATITGTEVVSVTDRFTIPCQLGGAPVVGIGRLAYYNKITSRRPIELVIPDGVEHIGAVAFRYNSIESLSLPDSISSIGEAAFFDVGLKSLRLPGSLANIEPNVFSDNNDLHSVVFSDGLKVIGCEAFENCASLQSVTIPASVERIERDAFAGCTKLTDVIIQGVDTRIEERAFYGATNAVFRRGDLDGNIDKTDSLGMTPLMASIRAGSGIAAISRLLEQGANVNAKNRQGMTPLMFAALQGNLEIIDSLLKRGADVSIRDKVFDNTALDFARWIQGRSRIDSQTLATHLQVKGALPGANEKPSDWGSVSGHTVFVVAGVPGALSGTADPKYRPPEPKLVPFVKLYWLKVDEPADIRLFSTSSNSAGRYELSLPPGQYLVEAATMHMDRLFDLVNNAVSQKDLIRALFMVLRDDERGHPLYMGDRIPVTAGKDTQHAIAASIMFVD